MPDLIRRSLPRVHTSRPPLTRRGGVLAGCLIALAILAVVVIVGIIIVVMNWRGWAASIAYAGAEAAVQQTNLPQQEKDEILADVRVLTDEFEAGNITLEELEAIGEEIGEGPLAPVSLALLVESRYVDQSGLSDDEKAEATVTLRRVMQGAFEETVTQEQLENALAPISDVGPEGNLQPREPERVSDEELREALSRAKQAADDAGVTESPEPVDVSAELRLAITNALGRDIFPADSAAPAEPAEPEGNGEDAGGEGGG